MSKNILVFSDGTGQAGGITPDENRSNIYKMYRATRCGPDSNINANEQIAFYDPGIGSLPPHGGFFSRTWRWIHNLVSGATGLGITTNIIDCYSWIVRIYEPGDHIFLFGFSRGAYTVRCLATALSFCGIPTLMPDGKPICRDIARSRSIAKEAIKKVYQFVNSPKDMEYLNQREELAANFRRKYGSDDNGKPNVVPFFIGVFDTVAALGSYMLSALLLSIAVFVLAVISYSLSYFFSSFLPIFLLSTIISLGVAIFWYCVEHIKFAKGLKNYNWWQRWHFTSPKMKFYDFQLNNQVWYARHALSIDENRADFNRVLWGGAKNKGPARPDYFPDWLQQIWFAGNHSDIGGGYHENESRLSDISLDWMVHTAINLPDDKTSTGNGIKVDHRFLQLNPDPLGPQHDERESGCLGHFWTEKLREIDTDAPLHPSVYKRFNAHEGALHFYIRKQYRPINLSDHEKLTTYFQSTHEKPPTE